MSSISGDGHFEKTCLGELPINCFSTSVHIEPLPSYIIFSSIEKLMAKCICLIAENFEQSNLTDLKSELKILIHVGGNENIVNILGACTKGL